MVDLTTAGILAGYLVVFLFAIGCFVHVHRTLPPSAYSNGLKAAFGMISLEILIPFSILIMSIMTSNPDLLSTEATTTGTGIIYIVKDIYGFLMMISYTIFGITQAEFFKSFASVNIKASRRLVMATRVFFVVDGALGVVLAILLFTTTGSKTLYLMLLQFSIILVQSYDVVVNMYMLHFMFVKMRHVEGMGRQKLFFVATWFVLMMFFVSGFGLILGGSGQNGDILTILIIMAHFYPLLSYLCMVCVRQVLAAKQKRKRKTPDNKDGYEQGLKENKNDANHIDQVDNNAKMDSGSANASGPHLSKAQYLSSKPSKGYEPPPNSVFMHIQGQL